MERFSSYGADKLRQTFGHVTSLVGDNVTAAYWDFLSIENTLAIN